MTSEPRVNVWPTAYGSRPYMQFPVFGGGEGAGAWGQISNRYISETAKDNPINMILYTH